MQAMGDGRCSPLMAVCVARQIGRAAVTLSDELGGIDMGRDAEEDTRMPLVRVDLRAAKPAEYSRAIGEGVHRAMVETLGCPSGTGSR